MNIETKIRHGSLILIDTDYYITPVDIHEVITYFKTKSNSILNNVVIIIMPTHISFNSSTKLIIFPGDANEYASMKFTQYSTAPYTFDTLQYPSNTNDLNLELLYQLTTILDVTKCV